MITVKKQLFDLTYLKRIDDKGLIAEVINLYLEETQLELFKMEVAFDKSDYENIRATVEKMKISTGMIQADRLYLVLEEIAILAKYGGEYDKLNELEHIALHEFDQLKDELELYLKDIYSLMENEYLPDHQSPIQIFNHCC